MSKLYCLLFAFLASAWTPLFAGEFGTAVDMRANGASAYYVSGAIAGFGDVDLMVDTGSGYMTINEEMLERLKDAGQVRYIKQLRGRLANGSEMNVPVYLIQSMNIGGRCWLNGVEAAVFPGKTRAILGLNALQRAGPFIFSFEPPQLVLSNCAGPTTAEAGEQSDFAVFEE